MGIEVGGMTKNQRDRLKLEADIKAYLSQGGKVKQLEWGESKDSPKDGHWCKGFNITDTAKRNLR